MLSFIFPVLGVGGLCYSFCSLYSSAKGGCGTYLIFVFEKILFQNCFLNVCFLEMETEQAYGSSLGANDSPSCLPFHCPAGALFRTEKIPYHTEVIIKNKKAYKNILESKAARNKERRKIVPASFSHRFLLLWSHYSNLFRQEKKGSAKPISISM